MIWQDYFIANYIILYLPSKYQKDERRVHIVGVPYASTSVKDLWIFKRAIILWSNFLSFYVARIKNKGITQMKIGK